METEPEKKLSALLEGKRFSELTLEERTFVLSIISEEKFESYRRLLGEEDIPLGLSIEELTIGAEVKDNVLAAFKTKHKKEKRSPFLIFGFLTKRQMLIRVPLAFGVLALIGILIVNMNQHTEHLIVEGPVVSDVIELNKDDSVKIVEEEPSVPSDPNVTRENEVQPKLTLKPERKERVYHRALQNNPKIAQASITPDHLELNIEEMEKYILYSQAGLNEKLVVPERVAFEDAGSLLMPVMYENLGM